MMVTRDPPVGHAPSVFVGREGELSVLTAALADAATRGPQIVWIEGEAGIGKTALLRRFLASVTDAPQLLAGGDESEIELEYGVIDQLLGDPDRPPGESVFSVGAAVLRALGASPSSTTTIVAVDDLHWLDSASAGALLFALRRLQGERLLVLLAGRPDPVARLGASWPRLLEDPDRVRRLRLGGLSATEVGDLARSLAGRAPSATVGERLRVHTRGHPLHLRTLISELGDVALDLPDDAPLPAPRSFAATVLTRLTGLEADAQALVAAAAVAGPRSSTELVATVAGVTDPETALRALRAADLIEPADPRSADTIAFTHPLVRAAIRDDLPRARRRALHRALAERSDGAAALDHRAAASDGRDDSLADELAAEAEREIDRAALGVAARRLLQASRTAADPARHDRFLLLAAECLMLAGDRPALIGLGEAIVACADTPLKRFVLGAMTAALGRLDDAETQLRAVAGDPHTDPELAGRVGSALAIVYGYLNRGEDAVRWARTALRAPRLPPTVTVTARQALALGLASRVRGEEAVASLADLSPSLPVPRPFEAELLSTRGNIRAWCGDLAGARVDLTAVVGWARAGYAMRSLPNAYGALALTEYGLGHWQDGLVHAEVAVSLAHDTDRVWDLSSVHAISALLHADRGEVEEARAHATAARRAAEDVPLPMSVYWGCIAGARLAAHDGDLAAAEAALAPLADGDFETVGALMGAWPWRVLRAEARTRAGATRDARADLDVVRDSILELSGEIHRAALWRAQAELEIADRDLPAAEAALDAGADAARRAGAEPLAAAIELTRGRLLRAGGRRREAITALRGARQRLAGLGARPGVSACDVELAACGVRTRAPRAENRFGLTAREQVVARLVATGHSNREVGEELYLSTKAIEYHLSNVFAKVGIRSRHELAARLADPD